MATVNLRVIHRILLMGYLNDEGQKSGQSLSDIRRILKLLDRVDFTEDERKAYNILNENSQIKWHTTKDGMEGGEVIDVPKPIELSDEQFDFLKVMFKKKDEAKEYSFRVENAAAIMELSEQFGITS